MNIENAEKVWAEQSVPGQSPTDLSGMIRQQNSKSKRQLYCSFAFVILCLLFGVLNFYGQYFVNGDGLLVSSLRFSVVLIAIPIHLQVHRRLAKNYRDRVEASANQCEWLSLAVANLDQELHGGQWKLGAFFLAVLGIVCATKWLDYRSGTDTLAECIAIPIAVAVVMLIVSVGVWHYRTTFLEPEYARLSSLQAGMERES